MGGRVGEEIKYDSEQGNVFLGRDYTQHSNSHSGQIAYEIDVQVRKIIDECYAKAKEIIEANKDKLVIIADALLEYETLAGEQIEALFNTGRMLDRHDGTNDENSDNSNDNQTTVSFDNADDLLDDMK